jgi:predicted DNA-binding transcriptional regulator YafY
MTRRADRLFQIAELLRGRRLTTAQQLADWLHVSLRTVYRDVQDLQLSGVPIEGEPGIGYRLSRSASLPPLTFTAEELTALAAGARMLESWGGESMAAGARGALAKIASAMPADKRATIDRLAFFAP